MYRQITGQRLALSIVLLCGFALLSPAAHAHAEDGKKPHRLRDTAYTLDRGDVAVGVLDLQLGLLDEVTIGTYVAPWILYPVFDAVVPNAFVKVRDWFHGPVNFSLRASLLYLPPPAVHKLGGGTSLSAAAFNLPLEAAASVEIGHRFTQSASLTYVLTELGASHSSTASLAGAVSASQLTFSALTEYHLSRALSITMLARVLIARSNVRARVQAESGSTQIDADIGVSTNYGHLVPCVIPGIALRTPALNLELGLGYGSLWLPILDLPVPFDGVVGEANVYVVF